MSSCLCSLLLPSYSTLPRASPTASNQAVKVLKPVAKSINNCSQSLALRPRVLAALSNSHTQYRTWLLTTESHAEPGLHCSSSSSSCWPKISTSRSVVLHVSSCAANSNSSTNHAAQHTKGTDAVKDATNCPAGSMGSKLHMPNPLRMLFGSAWKKAVPLSVLFFSATFIFTMLQSLKDGIVVIEMGADALPFLTTLGTLPASLAYFNFYRYTLVPNVPPQQLYYATAVPFLAFYALFAFVLYPLAPALQNPAWLAWSGFLPQGLTGLVACIQKWMFSLFYVIGDLWGPVMITLAFWTVADEVCTMEEAGQLYPQLGLLANLGLVGSGRFIKAVHNAVGHTAGMGGVLKVLVTCMLLMSGVMFACKWVINRRYLRRSDILAEHDRPHKSHQSTHRELHHRQQQQQQQQGVAPLPAYHSSAGGSVVHAHHQHSQQQQQQPVALQPLDSVNDSRSSSRSNSTMQQHAFDQEQHRAIMTHTSSRSCSPSKHHSSSSSTAAAAAGGSRSGAQKAKPSWHEALAVFVGNPIAAELTTWVVSFGVALRLFEYAFKSQLRLAAADSAAYCSALADIQSAVGMATLGLMMTSKLIFKHFGWSGAALISPSVMLVLGSAFFICCLLAQGCLGAAAAAPATMIPAAAAVANGSGRGGFNILLHTLILRLGVGSDVAYAALATLGVGFGVATCVAAGACRSSLFQPTKEMVYKTMPAHESKESKAVVDLIGGQIAKSGAGWLVQLLLLASGSISAAYPAMAVLYMAAGLAWLKSTLRLSTHMKQYATEEAELSAVQQSAAAVAQQSQQQEWEVRQQQLEFWQRCWQQQREVRRRRLHRRRRQQLGGWKLPLPWDLAVAAAAASRWSATQMVSPGAEAAHTAGNNADNSGSSSSSAATSSNAECGDNAAAAHSLLLQPPMLRDAEYWDSVYAALAEDPLLLETVLLGKRIPVQPQAHQDQQQQRHSAVAVLGGTGVVHEGQTESSSSSSSSREQQQVQATPIMNGVALAKQALHTTFDVY